jgi:hypothetical protein
MLGPALVANANDSPSQLFIYGTSSNRCGFAHHITHDATAPSWWVAKGYLRSTSRRRGCERQQLWTREMDREKERERESERGGDVSNPKPSVHPMKKRVCLSTYATGWHNSELSGSWFHDSMNRRKSRQRSASRNLHLQERSRLEEILVQGPCQAPSLSLNIYIYKFPCAVYICLYAKLSGVGHRQCMQQHN